MCMKKRRTHPLTYLMHALLSLLILHAPHAPLALHNTCRFCLVDDEQGTLVKRRGSNQRVFCVDVFGTVGVAGVIVGDVLCCWCEGGGVSECE